MMTPINIATVSYLNTIPFVYGLQCAKETLHTELLLDIPSKCTSNFTSGKADIALIPAADLQHLSNYKIVTNHCIGAEGKVRSVILASSQPLNFLKRIYLDSHSHTSAQLVKVLASELWNVSVDYIPLTDYSKVGSDKEAGYLLIGDKVFDYEAKFSHIIDLAFEWYKLTSLPFVFAVWVARPWVDDSTIVAIDNALTHGTKHICEAINSSKYKDKFNLSFEYLTNNISYPLTKEKKNALRTFLQKVPPSSTI